jgi:hypothetical protein
VVGLGVAETLVQVALVDFVAVLELGEEHLPFEVTLEVGVTQAEVQLQLKILQVKELLQAQELT